MHKNSLGLNHPNWANIRSVSTIVSKHKNLNRKLHKAVVLWCRIKWLSCLTVNKIVRIKSQRSNNCFFTHLRNPNSKILATCPQHSERKYFVTQTYSSFWSSKTNLFGFFLKYRAASLNKWTGKPPGGTDELKIYCSIVSMSFKNLFGVLIEGIDCSHTHATKTWHCCKVSPIMRAFLHSR